MCALPGVEEEEEQEEVGGGGSVRVQCVLWPALSVLFVYAAGLGRQQGFVQDPVTVAPLQSNIATPPRPRRSASTPPCATSPAPPLFSRPKL